MIFATKRQVVDYLLQQEEMVYDPDNDRYAPLQGYEAVRIVDALIENFWLSEKAWPGHTRPGRIAPGQVWENIRNTGALIEIVEVRGQHVEWVRTNPVKGRRREGSCKIRTLLDDYVWTGE